MKSDKHQRFQAILREARKACRDEPDTVAGYLASWVNRLEQDLEEANRKLEERKELSR